MMKCPKCDHEAEMTTEIEWSPGHIFFGLVLLVIGAPLVLLGFWAAGAAGNAGALVISLFAGFLCYIGIRCFVVSRSNRRCPSCRHKWYESQSQQDSSTSGCSRLRKGACDAGFLSHRSSTLA